MRFEVLVAVPVKIAILRGVTQCSLVGNCVSEKPAAYISRATLHHNVMSEMK